MRNKLQLASMFVVIFVLIDAVVALVRIEDVPGPVSGIGMMIAVPWLAAIAYLMYGLFRKWGTLLDLCLICGLTFLLGLYMGPMAAIGYLEGGLGEPISDMLKVAEADADLVASVTVYATAVAVAVRGFFLSRRSDRLSPSGK